MQDANRSSEADPTITLKLDAQPLSPGLARAFVAEQWRTMDAVALSDVQLIVSELVTNAIKHGRPDIELRLRRGTFAIDVSVLDHGPGEPNVQNAEVTATSGRGLAIIDQLVKRWGCDALEEGTGKIVWASLEAT